MSYKIIVSRYNENIDWLKGEIKNCIIYNKGDKLNIENEIMLENIGRESQTYLHYIITNYYDLPDIVVFTQARISDHKGKDDIGYLLNLKEDAFKNFKSQNYLTHYDKGNSIYWDKTWNLRNGIYYLQNNYKDNKPITFYEYFKNTFCMGNVYSYPDPIKIYCNAIFAVRKEKILQHSIEFYKNIIMDVNHHIDPAEGHFFERSWFYIFY
jgi:hypothetical protein